MNLFFENVRLALFSLKANKMRALLTMLGIIIGISSVIAIMTVGNSLSSYMTGELSSLGTNNVYVSIAIRENEEETTEEGYSFVEENNQAHITADDLMTREMIENYADTYADNITAIGIQKNVGSGQIFEGTKSIGVDVKGVTLGYMLTDNKDLKAGRFFTGRETEGAKRVCIVSNKVVDKMFGGDDEAALGSIVQTQIETSFYDFTIVGIYNFEAGAGALASYMSMGNTTDMYIPFSTACEMNHSDYVAYFTVLAKPDVDPDAFADLTKQFFVPYYRNNRNVYIDSYSMASYVEMMSSMMGTLTTAISVIAGIALLVGGIGVMNIMLVSITERTREIGTRKALGAPNSSIRLQFIVEAVVICMIGGIIGILIGVGGGSLAAGLLLKSPANPSIASIFGSLLFSMAIGVFFGYYPANKAAKMDPIEALRYE
ncbi:MAG: ABC transporter permease [Lachnospiraceae bacterium]|nr:ABC transporter permease [Lachnospiraceae bacterium]